MGGILQLIELSFRAVLAGVRCDMRDLTMLPGLFFLWMLSPSYSASIWEQIQDPDGSTSTTTTRDNSPAGVSGGFWGSLLEHREQSEDISFRNSQRHKNHQIETLGGENAKRQILPSSLRSLHTLHTEYEEDYGEMFDQEESRTEQLFKSHHQQ